MRIYSRLIRKQKNV